MHSCIIVAMHKKGKINKINDNILLRNKNTYTTNLQQLHFLSNILHSYLSITLNHMIKTQKRLLLVQNNSIVLHKIYLHKLTSIKTYNRKNNCAKLNKADWPRNGNAWRRKSAGVCFRRVNIEVSQNNRSRRWRRHHGSIYGENLSSGGSGGGGGRVRVRPRHCLTGSGWEFGVRGRKCTLRKFGIMVWKLLEGRRNRFRFGEGLFRHLSFLYSLSDIYIYIYIYNI